MSTDLSKLQGNIGEWSEENFSGSGGTLGHDTYVLSRVLLSAASQFARCLLKSEQDIRGDSKAHKLDGHEALRVVLESARSLQTSLPAEGDYDADSETSKVTRKIFGAYEELGELIEAVDQGTEAQQKDAIADTMIYLLDTAHCLGIDAEAALEETAEEVLGRDWNQHREDDYSEEPIYGEEG